MSNRVRGTCVDGSPRTVNALAPGQRLAVRFQLTLPAKLDWAAAQVATADVDAVGRDIVAPRGHERPVNLGMALPSGLEMRAPPLGCVCRTGRREHEASARRRLRAARHDEDEALRITLF